VFFPVAGAPEFWARLRPRQGPQPRYACLENTLLFLLTSSKSDDVEHTYKVEIPIAARSRVRQNLLPEV
jgi:hypothetical protein